MHDTAADQFCRRTRREFLWETGAGFGALGLTGLLAQRSRVRQRRGRRSQADHEVRQPAGPEEAAVRRPRPRASSSCSCTAARATSTRSTTSPKLYPLDGKTIPVKTFGRGGHEERGPRRRAEVEVQAVRPVRQVGQRPVPAPRHVRRRHRLPPLDVRRLADPRLGHAADEHRAGSSPGSPCLGSWVNYGLGSVNENLPGFVVMLDPTGGPISGPKNWSSGYMPAAYQGAILRAAGDADPRPRRCRRA